MLSAHSRFYIHGTANTGGGTHMPRQLSATTITYTIWWGHQDHQSTASLMPIHSAIIFSQSHTITVSAIERLLLITMPPWVDSIRTPSQHSQYCTHHVSIHQAFSLFAQSLFLHQLHFSLYKESCLFYMSPKSLSGVHTTAWDVTKHSNAFRVRYHCVAVTNIGFKCHSVTQHTVHIGCESVVLARHTSSFHIMQGIRVVIT